MFKNYFRVALRNLIKQRVYSIINIVGLAVGIAGCLLIVLFVTDEMSYDKFHDKADRIYKMALERKYPNHATFFAVIPHSYAEVIPKDFPEVEAVVRMGGPFNDIPVSYKTGGEEKRFEEDFIMAADSSFFNVFSIKLIKGEPNTVFKNLTDLVLTEETARRYFGSEDPIGKTLNFFGQDFNVTGICENIPDNSHFKFDFLTKWSDQFFGNGREANFITFSAHVYLLLKPETSAAGLEAKFPKMVDTYAAGQIEKDLGKSWEDYKKEGNGYRYFLQPLTSIHLDPTHIESKMKPGGNQNYVYFLICVASLIVAIACINFMNLATARSAERAKEVGVRKTMGSAKTQLMAQFLVESILICLVATVFAVILAELAMPYFSNLASKQLALKITLPIAVGLVGFAVFVGLLAGSYPAFALSSFNPVAVMKGSFSGQSKGASWLRNGLVVFQFWISIVLIVGTLVVGDQMRYMHSKSLGYDKDNMLIVERVFALQGKAQTFIDELKRIPGVKNAASSFALLGREGDYFGSQFLPEGSTEVLTTKSMVISDDLAETVGFELVQGRAYSKETQDSLSIMLNETAVKTLGLGANPIGQKLNQIQRNQNGAVHVPYTVIGVFRDFNFQSLRDQITPLTILSNESFGGGAGYGYAKVSSQDLAEVTRQAEEKWKTLSDGQPFKFRYLDETLKANYENEQRAGTLFSVFSGLAILIACVGLFGLAAYTASLRTKEIGVRKVLGASVGGVVLLLSKDFTKLILIAFVLAVPLGWYIMNSWLDGFAYRTTLSVGTFLIAGGLALVISWATVSYQSVKAAVRNPVKSLRSE